MALSRSRWTRVLFAAVPLTALSILPLEPVDQGELQGHRSLTDGSIHTGGSLPLAPERTVHFTTDEGTWLSLDVSPDGKTIVFDLLGDLYSLPIDGGTAVPITQGPSFDSQPRFSPDGRKLVFTSDQDGWTNVWISDRDGSNPRQITYHRWGLYRDRVSSPVWAPDGRGVVVCEKIGPYPTFADFALVEYDVSSGATTLITGLDGTDRRSFLGPAFGPDSDTLWASVSSATTPSKGQRWRLARVQRQTGTVTLDELAAGEGWRSAARPLTTRDGKYLVYTARDLRGAGLRLRELTSGQEKWLVPPGQVDFLAFDGRETRDLAPGSAFDADSQYLFSAFAGKIWRIELTTGRAIPIPFQVDVKQELGSLVKFDYSSHDTELTVRSIRHPELSPDGSRLVFSALDRLWIAEIPATAFGPHTSDGRPEMIVPRRLTNDSQGEFFPTWSPDGRFIVFTGWSAHKGGAIYRIAATGDATAERLSTEPGVYLKPAFVRDGSDVLALYTTPETWRRSTTIYGEASRQAWIRQAAFNVISVPSQGGVASRVADYPLPKTSATAAWKSHAFVYGKLQALPDGDIGVYDFNTGLVSLRSHRTIARTLIRFAEESPWYFEGRPLECILSPDGRRALLLLHGSRRPYLLEWRGRLPLERVLSLFFDIDSIRGPYSLQRLSTAAADFVGWTVDGRPYFTRGSTLFIGEAGTSLDTAHAPRFREVQIDLRVRRDRPIGTLLLRGGRVLTMRGKETIHRGDVLIRNGRIVAVGPSGTIRPPAGAKILDVTGKTVLPGYIDVHAHVGFIVPWGVHDELDWRLLVDLSFGVTTVRDPVDSPDLLSLAERGSTGDLVSPRIHTVVGAVSQAFFGDGSSSDLADTRDVLRLWAKDYHTETIKQYMAGGRRTRQLIAMAARELQLTPTNEGGAPTSMSLTMVLDGYAGFEHSLPELPLARDVVRLVAESGTIPTPTIGAHGAFASFLDQGSYASYPKIRRFVPRAVIAAKTDTAGTEPALSLKNAHLLAAQVAKIIAHGGCAALGSHGDVPGIGAHWELWLLAAGGLSHYDTLRVGTVCSAEAIGHSRELGSLTPGHLADIQILDENPLDDIKNTLSIRYVIKNGHLYDAATLDELWPTPRRLGHRWWQD